MNTPVVNDKFKLLEQGNITCFYNHSLINPFDTNMLSPNYWQKKKAITGSAQGRGTTWFLQYTDDKDNVHDWVLRHYYRGGLIGKLINDSYWFSGLKNTRAAQEFSLLRHMETLHLPAPKPVAYKVVRQGLFYKADLLSTRINNARDLVAILSEKQLPEDVWHNIGATIKRFHQHSIYHHDLNSHNILLNDNEQVFIIDFDRGELRTNPTNTQWKNDNMARLERSFLKELNKLERFYFSNDNWKTLLEGYQAQ